MLLKSKAFYACMLCLLLVMVTGMNARAQKRDIDSLKELLETRQKRDTNRVNVLNSLAYNYYSNNLDDLKVYGNQALLLSDRLKYKKGEAIAYKNIGLGYLADKANPLALDYFDKSLNIFRSLGDRPNAGKVLNNIGYYYGIIKDHRQELYYFLQAMQTIDGLNQPHIKAVLLGNIGNSYEAVGDISQARDFYDKALKISIESNLPGESATSYANLASIELKDKHFTAAINFCDTVIKMKNRSDNFRPRTLATVYSLLGRIYFQLRQFKESYEAYMQSAAIARQIGRIDETVNNYYGFYQLDSVKGDYHSAFKNYYQYTRLNDSLMSVAKNQQVSMYQVKYDAEKRNDENQRLKVEDDKNQAVIHQQGIIQTILIIGIIIICLGVLYLKYTYDQMKTKNNIINEQNRVLENNNVVKDKLFSVISHDLRSPITQVVGLLNLLDAGEMSMEEMASLTPAVKSSIVNTLALLDNLLIWSRDQLQGFHLNREIFSLQQLVEENILALNGIIQQKKLTVTNAVKPGVAVNADREMIQIVLRNLISNAVKFTNPNGTIVVSSETDDDNVIICVADTGIGIKEADRHKIFSFTSHTTLGTANEKGTGIGLKICKDFIELNNGKIWIESEENVGSKFYVSIPL